MCVCVCVCVCVCALASVCVCVCAMVGPKTPLLSWWVVGINQVWQVRGQTMTVCAPDAQVILSDVCNILTRPASPDIASGPTSCIIIWTRMELFRLNNLHLMFN